jgi:hypothetical protein
MNLPPGISTADIPGVYLRDEEVIERDALCEVCGWEGLAEVIEGLFVDCQCGADGLVSA